MKQKPLNPANAWCEWVDVVDAAYNHDVMRPLLHLRIEDCGDGVYQRCGLTIEVMNGIIVLVKWEELE